MDIEPIQKQQWAACDKVWQAYEDGKLTLDQAIEAAYRTHVKMTQALEKIGLESLEGIEPPYAGLQAAA